MTFSRGVAVSLTAKRIVVVVFMTLVAGWSVFPQASHAQTALPKLPKPQKAEKSEKEKEASPTLKIELKEKKGKQGAQVEVKVEGAKDGKKAGPGKASSSGKTVVGAKRKEIVAARGDRIYELSRKLSQKIDYIAFHAGSIFGIGSNKEVYAGIRWLKLLVSLIVLLLFFTLERLVSWLISMRLKRSQESAPGITWKGFILEALRKPLSLFLWVYGTYLALTPLYPNFEDPDGANVVYSVAQAAADFAGTVAIIWFLYALSVGIETRLEARAKASESTTDRILASLLGRTLRTFVIVLGAIVILQNLTGLEIGALLASLGLGGFAVALAAKDSISNFFGTVTIFMDKPFRVGDRVIIDKYDGFVEAVGYRSTRIRTFEGGIVSIPNEKTIHAAVDNIGARPHIRWRTDIGLQYDTPPEKVEQAIAILHEILDNHEGMHEEFPPRIYFDGLKDGTLNIAVFAWYRPPDYWEYMEWVQENCLRYLKRFHEQGIRIAIPSRMVYTEDATWSPGNSPDKNTH